MFIDTHCHLDFPEFDKDRDEVIRNAESQGIDYIINIGSSLEGSIRSLALASQYRQVYATIGIHPHDADSFNANIQNNIKELAKREKVVAIGEIGLDYYRDFSHQENQRSLFMALVRLAKDLNLPVVIHCRQAQDDVLKILKEALPLKAVVHCFSGDKNFLDECLALGFLVSFTCNITYKKAQNLRDLVKVIPLEKLLLETDAPFLPPEIQRGRRNEPANVRYLAQEISRIKGVGIEEVAGITSDNAQKFFHIK
jgi:TatD DNase family protein